MEMRNVSKLSFFPWRDRKLKEYVIRCIRNPDAGSEFARKTALIQRLPSDWFTNSLIIMLLWWKRYDGILLIEDGQVIGHLFYQKYPENWNVFAVFIREDLRGRKLADVLIKKFLHMAHDALPRIEHVRLGAGNSEKVRRKCEKILRGEYRLNFALEKGEHEGRIYFKGR